MTDLGSSQVHAVVGVSWRLRSRVADGLVASWVGPVRRVSDPAYVEDILLGLDTPSLFEAPTCWLVRAEEPWLRTHRDRLLGLVGQPAHAGVLVLSVAGFGRNDALQKALAKAGALVPSDPPQCANHKALRAWLVAELGALPQGVEQPEAVADALLDRRGDDLDALLAAMEQACLWCEGAPLRAKAVNEALGGDVERPMWTAVEALLSGRVAQALGILARGKRQDPHAVLGALAGEIRTCLACLASENDDEAAAWAGVHNRGRLFYARRRAQDLGREALQRILWGVLLAQRQLRQAANDPDLVLEGLGLNIQRVIRPTRS